VFLHLVDTQKPLVIIGEFRVWLRFVIFRIESSPFSVILSERHASRRNPEGPGRCVEVDIDRIGSARVSSGVPRLRIADATLLGMTKEKATRENDE